MQMRISYSKFKRKLKHGDDLFENQYSSFCDHFDERRSVKRDSFTKRPFPLPINNCQSPKEQDKKQQETFQKKCVGEHINHGISVWIKYPVLISKQDFMKSNENLFKINKHHCNNH